MATSSGLAAILRDGASRLLRMRAEKTERLRHCLMLPRPVALYMSGQNPETPMARKAQDYDDIPGTFVFDAERSRQGFGINMFCMSLMKDENRKAFKANEPEYLKKFNLTPEQADTILKRDYNRMLELGGNIYFTAKLG